MYVSKAGTVNYFCSKRCYKNAMMRRKLNKKEAEVKK
jgi:ribosomal protein L24E